jgi:diadenylate cyclase
MSTIFNLVLTRLRNLNFSQPLALVDLVIAITLLVSFLFYIRKFPAFRVLIGILFMWFCSVIFFLGGFTLTGLLFGLASNLILISLPLLFAPEIRHYMGRLGRLPFLKIPKLTQAQKKAVFIQDLVSTVYEMGEKREGGTIVLQRKTGLIQTIETGVILDAKFSSELLRTIFYPKTALHDGAVVIQGDRIHAASCLLPIVGEVRLGPPFGTRHKSALAVTRDTDAVVVIISEQRGHVSLAENGKLDNNIERDLLTEKLLKLL